MWHTFRVPVWNPTQTPPEEENFFELNWEPRDGRGLVGGRMRANGWPVLGDWDYLYSEWSGWGTCSALCGGGTQRQTRRIILEPPPGSRATKCYQPLMREEKCNEQPCVFPCEIEDKIAYGNCTAKCGEGIRVMRQRFHGDTCPKPDDVDALQWEACRNQPPCTPQCLLSDTWTVATDCSAECGPGSFKMFRQVVQKADHDKECQAEWKTMPCMQHRCAPLNIIKPDLNIMPYAEHKFRVKIVFELSLPTIGIELIAPDGYSFGSEGDKCDVQMHDMMPNYRSCKVVQSNRIELRFWQGLDPEPYIEQDDRWTPRHHHFLIDVKNPTCSQWDEHKYGSVCKVSPPHNRWEIVQLLDVSQERKSMFAVGYELFHNPKEVPNLNDDEFVSSDGESACISSRSDLCSPRFPCDKNAKCNDFGICIPKHVQ